MCKQELEGGITVKWGAYASVSDRPGFDLRLGCFSENDSDSVSHSLLI